MKILTSLTIVAAVFGGVMSLAAAPLNPAHVSARAHWFVHADVDALKRSETGGLVMGAIEDEHSAKFRAFARLFSFNPMEDLEAVTIFGRNDKGVVLVYASIDPEHLVDLVAASDGYESMDHEGVTVHCWHDDGQDQAGAIVGDGLVILSDEAGLVKHALDVLEGREDTAGEDLIRPGGIKAPIVIGVADLSEMKGIDPEAAFLREAKSMRMTLGERAGRLEASMEMVLSNSAKVKQITALIEGMIAFGELAEPRLNEMGIEVEMTSDEGSGRIGATISLPIEEAVEYLKREMARQADKI